MSSVGALGEVTRGAEAREIHQTYAEEGFIVARGLIDPALCEKTRALFAEQVRPFEGRILRQTTSKQERHNINEHGHVTNPMLDVHETMRDQFPAFHGSVLDVLTHPELVKTVETLFGEEAMMVQSMYFESSRGTDPHMDTHFIDAAEKGRLVGVWIALEDIDEKAGRFCVYPKSHRIYEDGLFSEEAQEAARTYEDHSCSVIRGYQLEGKSFSLNSVTKSRRLLRKYLQVSGFEPYSPALKAGDVLFFSSLAIHSSNKPTGVGQTRNSLTCHWVPKACGYARHGIYEPIPADLMQVRDVWMQNQHRPQATPA
ncbi:phytanoyl-CoA dioxygenase family protein [Acanthopleuribacter pedis]|uniref:Phytanoyl-CoA dioxygenase family protein n=1 Tax=Acanthopleuribacter pedis TaxID=442870 RepID=A0A8J7QK17_9BACT|nr:phytanoyl-CoA dioxygenase family protein [Acanthopleuribacter pedis]MBO1322361.1 phytanoyl-CoA dioxygenase family protein [Acanthopleuribacter pedis]